MSVRHVTINGSTKVWLARIAYHGVRKSRVCRTKEEARQAERELAAECRKDAERAETEEAAPATLRQLLTFYAGDMEARGRVRKASAAWSTPGARSRPSRPSCSTSR
jgi:hypothetical protein